MLKVKTWGDSVFKPSTLIYGLLSIYQGFLNELMLVISDQIELIHINDQDLGSTYETLL